MSPSPLGHGPSASVWAIGAPCRVDDRGRVALGQHQARLDRAVQLDLALLQQRPHLVAVDGEPGLGLPDREAAARLLLALVGAAAERRAVLDHVAVAVRAGAQRLGADVAEVVDQLLGEAGDVGHEAGAVGLPVLDLGQPLLPGAGQLRGREGVRAQKLDRVAALGGGHQRLALALDVADVQQPLDRVGAGGGGAEAAVLHGLAQLLVVDAAAGRLHGAQQRCLACSGRAAWSASPAPRPRCRCRARPRRSAAASAPARPLPVARARPARRRRPAPRQPASSSRRPLVRKREPPASVTTSVSSNRASGWNTAR